MSVLKEAISCIEDANGLVPLVASAVAVGFANGRFDRAEKRAILQLLGLVGCDHENAEQALDSVMENVGDMEASEIADWGIEQNRNSDDAIGEACVVIAAAVATRTGGIDAEEGVIIQQIADRVGVGYPSDRYMELLGEGMQIGRG